MRWVIDILGCGPDLVTDAAAEVVGLHRVQPSAAPKDVATLIHKKKRGNSERSANVAEYGSMNGATSHQFY
jgi:hypothetical protein